MIVADRPARFKPWGDFPGLDQLPAGTQVFTGKGLFDQIIVYFFNPADGVGFSMTADMVSNPQDILTHYNMIRDLDS